VNKVENEIFEKLEKINKDDLIKIIKMYHTCNTCSETDKINCKTQTIRQEIGMPACYGIGELYYMLNKPNFEINEDMRKIQDIMKRFENSFGKPIHIEKIVAEADKEGISQKNTLKTLLALEKEGFIFEPRNLWIQRL